MGVYKGRRRVPLVTSSARAPDRVDRSKWRSRDMRVMDHRYVLLIAFFLLLLDSYIINNRYFRPAREWYLAGVWSKIIWVTHRLLCVESFHWTSYLIFWWRWACRGFLHLKSLNVIRKKRHNIECVGEIAFRPTLLHPPCSVVMWPVCSLTWDVKSNCNLYLGVSTNKAVTINRHYIVHDLWTACGWNRSNTVAPES